MTDEQKIVDSLGKEVITDEELLSLYSDFLKDNNYTRIEVARLLFSMNKGIMKGVIESLDEIKQKGFWKEGTTTYVIEERDYPHDERCEGTMCYCDNRTRIERIEE